MKIIYMIEKKIHFPPFRSRNNDLPHHASSPTSLGLSLSISVVSIKVLAFLLLMRGILKQKIGGVWATSVFDNISMSIL